MNHVHVPTVRVECPQTKVGWGICSLRVAARTRRCNRNQLVGVLKLAGQVECSLQPDFRECLA